MGVDFETSACGKWILAGEHAVLRGSGALVFPLYNKQIKLKYKWASEGLSWNFSGEYGIELEFLFRGVFEKACELKKVVRSQIKGQLWVESNIPVGAGMGASAALCVALTRWLIHVKVVETEEAYDFARGLEDLFHGESSGVDIAVALSQRPLYFERSGIRQNCELTWKPHFYLSYSGQRGVTQECVKQVKSLFHRDPLRARILDQRMAKATQDCVSNLTTPYHKESFLQLCLYIQDAQTCFEEWGLAEGAPSRHITELREWGAAAVKVTGSGGGGYILSLWREAPSNAIIRAGHLISAL